MSEERHQVSTGSAIGLVSALSEELDRQPPRCREAGELTPIGNFPGWLWRDPEERSHGGERRFEVRDCEAEVPRTWIGEARNGGWHVRSPPLEQLEGVAGVVADQGGGNGQSTSIVDRTIPAHQLATEGDGEEGQRCLQVRHVVGDVVDAEGRDAAGSARDLDDGIQARYSSRHTPRVTPTDRGGKSSRTMEDAGKSVPLSASGFADGKCLNRRPGAPGAARATKRGGEAAGVAVRPSLHHDEILELLWGPVHVVTSTQELSVPTGTERT